MSDKSKIGWTDASWPIVTGCTHISSGCDHCLLPGTRVLRADMTWTPIEDIQVGDRLVAFTDSPGVGQNRIWEEAAVQAKWETEQPTVEVELANGATFTASEDHRWLLAQRGGSSWWRTTISLNFKTSVRAVRCDPVATATADYRAGYIAGATDGDGTFRWDPSWRSDKCGDPQSYWRIAKPVSDSAVLERLRAYLSSFGVTVEQRPFQQGPSPFTDHPVPMAKVETRKLANMPLIAAMCDEWASRDWLAGWLAGMFDTDASYSGGNLRFCQAKPNDVLDRVVRYGKELGFEFRPEDFPGGACPGARLVGGIAENIAFLSMVSPALTRRCRDFYGKRVETESSRVVGIRRGPIKRLIDITTSTGTFIAEGALTHNCYAAKLTSGRLKHRPEYAGLAENGRFNGTVRCLPDRMTWPYRWRAPRRIFVSDMADLFHEAVPDGFIAWAWDVMGQNQQHTFQVLTKRHARMRSFARRWADHAEDGDPKLVRGPEATAAAHPSGRGQLFAAMLREMGTPPEGCAYPTFDWMDGQRWWPGDLFNVHVGVSAEDQRWADIRIPSLLDTPAAVRFVSAEPLLGPIDLRNCGGLDAIERDWIGGPGGGTGAPHPLLDWVITGGESGPGHRPMDIGWLEAIVGQCRDAGVPVFVKQDSGPRAGQQGRIPDDLWIHEFPRALAGVSS